MLILTRRKKETIHIGDDIRMTIADVRHGVVSISVEAPKDVRVVAKELYQPKQTPSSLTQTSKE